MDQPLVITVVSVIDVRVLVNAAVFVKLQSINVPWRSQLLEWTSLVLSFDCLLLMKFQFFFPEILRLWLDVRSFL